MTTIWAKQSGNWNDTTLWAFWNESTQQIEDYGQIPQANDVVYCNGYDIYVDEGFAVQEVRNDRNPHTARSGGLLYVQTTATASAFIINADLLGSGTILRVQKNATNWTINGNVTGCSFYCPNNTTTMTFNGNCENLDFLKSGSLTHTLNFNGTLSIISRNLFSQNSYIVTIRRLIQSFLLQPSTAGLFGVLNVVDEYMPVGSFQSNVNIQLDGHLNLSQSNAQKPSDVIDGNHTLNLKGLTSTIDQKTDYPQPEDVRKNITYDFGQKVGTMEQTIAVGCVTKEDVREGVELIGLQEVGTLVVPSVDDVREGVIFDNGSVGTLIVQGGGDRLRIADFGYYTNAQSDTYIVDLTEQDKPKFAVAEERVLIEMFPDLDLDNIPEKYFDDLFVKYLKYRLIVEYYRTAGINSTFTPSEPTTEIVNYQNVRNEVWLNSANIYLKAWAKKYPESIVKPHRILL